MEEPKDYTDADQNSERERLWEVFEGKWTFHIVYALADGPLHYNAIRRQLGIPGSTLSKRLETLQDHGIINRTVKDTNPPTVEYSLTEKEREIAMVTNQLAEIERKWAERGR